MTWSNGSIVQELDYYAFGQAIYVASNPTWNDTHLFIGAEFDSESSLSYFQYRMLSTALGRWTAPDPVMASPNEPQSLNRYTYVSNNPTNFTDPLGLLQSCVNIGGIRFCVGPVDPTGGPPCHPPLLGGEIGEATGCGPFGDPFADLIEDLIDDLFLQTCHCIGVSVNSVQGFGCSYVCWCVDPDPNFSGPAFAYLLPNLQSIKCFFAPCPVVIDIVKHRGAPIDFAVGVGIAIPPICK